MTKVDIIARTVAIVVLVLLLMQYIVRTIERGEWLSTATGASAIACCLFIANHVNHLIHDKVKGDGEGDGKEEK